MDKLVYDSLYKFLVSIGLLLMALPFIVLALMFGLDPVLISQEEYDALSLFSKKVLMSKENVRIFFESKFHVILVISVAVGFLFFVIGLVFWIIAQREIDRELKLKNAKQSMELKELTAAEKIKKTGEEIDDIFGFYKDDSEFEDDAYDDEEDDDIDDEDYDDDEEEGNNHNQGKVELFDEWERDLISEVRPQVPLGFKREDISKIANYGRPVTRNSSYINEYLKVENAVFEKLSEEYKGRYTLEQDMRITGPGRSSNLPIKSADIVACAVDSEKDKDLVFDIKFFDKKIVSTMDLARYIDLVKSLRYYYENATGRPAIPSLLMVVRKENLAETKRINEGLLKKYEGRDIEIRFMTLDELNLNEE